MLHLLGVRAQEVSYGLGAYQYQGTKVEIIAHATFLIFVRKDRKGFAWFGQIAVAVYPVGMALYSCAQHTFYGSVAYRQTSAMGVEQKVVAIALGRYLSQG